MKKTELIIKDLQKNVRVIDTDTVKKVEFYNEYGNGIVKTKEELGEEVWSAYKELFRNE